MVRLYTHVSLVGLSSCQLPSAREKEKELNVRLDLEREVLRRSADTYGDTSNGVVV